MPASRSRRRGWCAVARRLLLEGHDLASLLVQVADELGPGAKVIRAERVRTGGFAGFFQREHFELTVDVPDAPPARRPVRAVPQPRSAPAAVGLDALLEAADAADGPATPGQGAAAAAPVVSTGGEAFADVLAQVRALAAERASATSVPSPAPTAPADAMPTVVLPPQPAPLADALTQRLGALGVPDVLLARAPGSLAALVAELPTAQQPPREPGSVIVVAGAAGAVDTTAALLADRLGLPTDAVVTAGAPGSRPPGPRGRGSRQQPSDVTAAHAWRAASRKAPHAWVVALAVGEGADERAAGSELRHAFAADQTWAVVDARTRTSDVAAWLTSVGPFDALAVRGLFDTAEPGAVLGLGVPVAWCDGIPATPAAWAAAFDRALDGAPAWVG